MILTIDELRALTTSERDIPQFCEVPLDLVERYQGARLDLAEQIGQGGPLEDLLLADENLEYAWEELMDCRFDKVVGAAVCEARTHRPDLLGILPWEKDEYLALVAVLTRLRDKAGLVKK